MADREKLRLALSELHAELERADELDPEIESQLRQALDDIRAKLARDKRSADEEVTEPEGVPAALEVAAVQFSESHPTIAGTLRRLIDVLAQMGI